MTAKKLVLSPASKEDLKEIYRYGNEKWGKNQSSAYLDDLKERMWSLIFIPLIGKERHDLLLDVRSVPFKSHVLFYRVTQDAVEIIRVLHGRQDPNNHINTDDKGD